MKEKKVKILFISQEIFIPAESEVIKN